PAEPRFDRAGGDAPPVHRTGGQPSRVPRVDAIPGPARRVAVAGGPEGSDGARPPRPLVPAEAALAVGLPPARHELRRVRGGGGPHRLLAAGGRGGLPEL